MEGYEQVNYQNNGYNQNYQSPALQLKTNRTLLKFILLSMITFGIMYFVWYRKISNRIGDELARRGINYDFDASTFWLREVIGSLIIVGPFIYMHRFLKSMNMLDESYNQFG